MWLFIRHDIKEYANGKGIPRLDPPLANVASVDHFEVLRNFTPDRIITSPFRRCRETCKRYYPEINPEVDIILSEYLGHWRDISSKDFDPETLKHIKDFRFENTVGKLENRLSYFKFQTPENTLVVTHGLCIEKLRKIFEQIGYSPTLLSEDPKFGFKIESSCK